MEAMAKMPDKAYDLAICDPPYMVDMSGGKAPKNRFKSLAHWDKMKQWNNERPSKQYFRELFRVAKNQIVWGANYFTEHLPPSMGWVFWYKMQDNFSFSDGEFAFTSFSTKARIFKYARGMESGFAPGGCTSPNIHPTQKPVRLYEWLLKNYAKPGDKILDTHGGSMSIAIACDIMGYDLDLYEIDKDYFEAGKKRLEHHQQQCTLFTADGLQLGDITCPVK